MDPTLIPCLKGHGQLEDADIAVKRRVLNLIDRRGELQVGQLLEEVL